MVRLLKTIYKYAIIKAVAVTNLKVPVYVHIKYLHLFTPVLFISGLALFEDTTAEIHEFIESALL